jgi:hypothetical protein
MGSSFLQRTKLDDIEVEAIKKYIKTQKMYRQHHDLLKRAYNAIIGNFVGNGMSSSLSVN